ncbi:MAG TPA: exodeoxyribonuclease VII large subunit [Candidatus Sulfotelmatobacter sp.]|nr:exodeoxyribonuclease VII large subunit [Candidatus Sulfotelmatobacter sp.]
MRTPLTVSQVSAAVRGLFASAPELEDALVEGEVSNITFPASGHIYLTLKDAAASLKCVCFRTQARQIPFRPENGMTVIAHGRIDVYETGGIYQLYIDQLEPKGVGALALAVEQRRKKLAAEGLLQERLKRRLPLLPCRVVVVTSRSGAALRDVLTITARRAPCVDVVLSPAVVQGERAAEALIIALQRAQSVPGAALILLVRGGGSLEDLMPFNDERLAREIRASRLPVVTGIGHETDVTIADDVADRRAPTPSAAAELAVPDISRLRADLASRHSRLREATTVGLRIKRVDAERRAHRLAQLSPQRRLPGLRQDLDARVGRLRAALLIGLNVKRRRLEGAAAELRLRSPRQRMPAQRQGVEHRRLRLEASLRNLLRAHRTGLDARRGRLGDLSPQRVIERGYSMTLDASSGRIISSVEGLLRGQRLVSKLRDGEVTSEIIAVAPTPRETVDVVERTDVR